LVEKEEGDAWIWFVIKYENSRKLIESIRDVKKKKIMVMIKFLACGLPSGWFGFVVMAPKIVIPIQGCHVYDTPSQLEVCL
jgi:hypothetical protein